RSRSRYGSRMAIDRVGATTWIRPRVPWLVLGAAIGAAVWMRGAPSPCTTRAPVSPRTVLHVEVGPAGWHVPAGVDVVEASPLFAHPEPALRSWARVVVDGAGTDAVARFIADGAREAFVEPAVSLAALDPGAGGTEASALATCPTRTPSYGELQEYLGPAP